MKTKHKILLIITCVTMLCARVPQQTNNIEKASWLIGTWENKLQRGSIYETWIKTNEKEYSGKSYVLKNNDTIVFETIRLVEENNQLFYIPNVKDQNGGKPVRFAAKTVSETQLLFENPKHDFPQVICYTKLGNDSLLAYIAKKDNKQKQTFPMKRIK